MVIILDPCLKLIMLEFSYNNMDASSSQAKIDEVKTMLFQLYEEYAKENPNSSSSHFDQPFHSSTSLSFMSITISLDVIDVSSLFVIISFILPS